ncbi:MAG: hypothetical protein WD894_14365 [Pirellulales bacterium]
MTFIQATRELHMSIAKHLTAEVKSEEFVPGNGVVVKWTCLRRQNHFFHALYYAAGAGWYCGVRSAQTVLEHFPTEQFLDNLSLTAKVDGGCPAMHRPLRRAMHDLALADAATAFLWGFLALLACSPAGAQNGCAFASLRRSIASAE